jgi:PKD repeat protein
LGDWVTLENALPAIWEDPSTSLRALQEPDSNERFAACYFNHEAFFVEMYLPEKSLVSFYFLDWEGTSRRQNITITDAYEPFGFLDSRALSSSFNGGVYLTWELKGHVRVEIAHTGGANAVLSGIFFDPVAEPENEPPVANFTFTVTDLEVKFTDQSTDSDGSVAAWSWSFGDGNTSNAENPTHTYSAHGTYTVTLTVTDDEGATGKVTKTVSVEADGTNPEIATMDSDLVGSSVTVNRNFWAGTVTVTVTSGGSPVPDATVQGTWSGGISGAVSGQTDSNGAISFSTGNLRNQVTTVTFTLTAVTKAGYDWSGTSSETVIKQP